jgi:hypothetical protein
MYVGVLYSSKSQELLSKCNNFNECPSQQCWMSLFMHPRSWQLCMHWFMYLQRVSMWWRCFCPMHVIHGWQWHITTNNWNWLGTSLLDLNLLQRPKWLLNRDTHILSNMLNLLSNIAPAQCSFVWTCQPNINYDVWLYLSAQASPLPVPCLTISNACCRVCVCYNYVRSKTIHVRIPMRLIL